MPIRVATVEDAGSISALIVPLAAEFIAGDFSDEGRNALLGSMTTDSIAGYLAKGFRYHVAETHDGKLLGVVSTRNDSHLYHLFVAESAQGRGLARRLWEIARDACASANSTGRFTVNSSRFAVGFYEHLGFIAAGPVEERGGVSSYPMTYDWSPAPV